MPSSPSMVPPKSQRTTSPSRITRSPGSWWGLAALAPAATMAKFTRWWPSARRRRPSSADTCASVRPTSSMSPAWSSAATRSAAAPALLSASTSAASLRARSGPITSLPLVNTVDGRACCRSMTNRAQVRSPMPTRFTAPTRSATIVIGSSVSSHERTANTSGRSTTRGASRRGTTRVASPSTGSTSMVSRSRGMASYPVR